MSTLCSGGTAIAAAVVLSSATFSLPPLPPWTLLPSWLAVVAFTLLCEMLCAVSTTKGAGGLPRFARVGCGGCNGVSAALGQDAVNLAEKVVRTRSARVRNGGGVPGRRIYLGRPTGLVRILVKINIINNS